MPPPLRLGPAWKWLQPRVHVDKWRRVSHWYAFLFRKRIFNLLPSEYAFCFRKRISPYALSVFPPRDPLVMKIFTDWSLIFITL